MQVVGQYPRLVTIEDALEAAAWTAGEKPVEERHAAAMQATEVRGTRLRDTLPGGVAAANSRPPSPT